MLNRAIEFASDIVRATGLAPYLELPLVRLGDIDESTVAGTILNCVDGMGWDHVFDAITIVKNQRRPVLDIGDRTRVKRVAATAITLRELEEAGVLEHPLSPEGTEMTNNYRIADRLKLREIAGLIE